MSFPFTSIVSSAYLKLGVAVALIAGLAYCVWVIRDSGVQACERKHQVELAEHIERAAAQAHQIALQDAEVISWADAKTRDVFKTRWKEHENISYADCSLSPAGRVLWNRATRAATDLTDTGEQGEPDQPAADAGDGDAEGNDSSASEEHGSDAAVGSGQGSGTPDATKPGAAWWRFWP
jgi:hypothetical protein